MLSIQDGILAMLAKEWKRGTGTKSFWLYVYVFTFVLKKKLENKDKNGLIKF